MKKEIRTTKIKDRVRAPEMEGNRVRKRKKTAVFFRVSACRIFKIKKQKTKKKIGKKVKSKLIIKYNRGKTSMQIQNLRNRKRFSNNNRDLSQSSFCYNHILSCGYFSCEDKRKKLTETTRRYLETNFFLANLGYHKMALFMTFLNNILSIQRVQLNCIESRWFVFFTAALQ